MALLQTGRTEGKRLSTVELVVLTSVVGTGVLSIVLIMWFVSTHNRRILRGFREPAETVGTIVNIVVERNYQSEGSASEPYVITYSYYDGSIVHERSFKSLAKKQVHKLQINDRIVVYYDRQKPDNAVTALQIEWEKPMWWRILLAFALIIMPAVVYVFYIMS